MIGEQIKLIDEDYIINLTNKGMYKRASKAMEKEEVIMVKEWEFKVGEECVVLHEKLEDFQCTCPATDYCKHVIMTYIFLMTHKEDSEEEISLSLEDFITINHVTNKDIKKYTSQKVINDAVIDYERLTISHELGSLLKINLGHGKMVNFTYPFDLEEAFKRNEEKDTIYAIKYIQNLNNRDSIQVEFKIPEPEVLHEIANYLENLIAIGLYSIKESEIHKIEFLSIKLKLNKYNFLFKKMQKLKGIIERYLSNDIDYKLENVNKEIIDILSKIYTLLSETDDYYKYRLFRRSENKVEINELVGYGLGYEIVNLKDETKLINMIILNKEDKEIYTMTNLRKQNSVQHMMLFVDNTHSAKSMEHKHIRLKNVMMKEDNKISNSSSLKLIFEEDEDLNIEDYAVSMSEAINQFIEEGQTYFILSQEIDGFYDFQFREEVQRFEMKISGITAYFKYEDKKDSKIIDFLQSLKQIDHLLIKLQKNDYYIEAKLIALWDQGKKIILRES